MGLFSVFTTNSGVIDSTQLAEDFERIITNSEKIEVGFKLNENTFIFTDKRLILIEVRKDGDKAYEYISLPYSKISTFSVESKKSFGYKSRLKIWLNGQELPQLDKEFNKSIDVYEVQKILANHVLN
ncbi:PH domain-containing protein [Marivirga sp.]|uniref:PH domain-containing protein n=1 Tax=Marivirga sp. TaxID=2018662 RepID=UPI002D80D558|nr:PH domain-containing protein [Marivirga sp.]HET8859271.1 PH domain-containing protein [Marivirga sp.]